MPVPVRYIVTRWPATRSDKVTRAVVSSTADRVTPTSISPCAGRGVLAGALDDTVIVSPFASNEESLPGDQRRQRGRPPHAFRATHSRQRAELDQPVRRHHWNAGGVASTRRSRHTTSSTKFCAGSRKRRVSNLNRSWLQAIRRAGSSSAATRWSTACDELGAKFPTSIQPRCLPTSIICGRRPVDPAECVVRGLGFIAMGTPSRRHQPYADAPNARLSMRGRMVEQPRRLRAASTDDQLKSKSSPVPRLFCWVSSTSSRSSASTSRAPRWRRALTGSRAAWRSAIRKENYAPSIDRRGRGLQPNTRCMLPPTLRCHCCSRAISRGLAGSLATIHLSTRTREDQAYRACRRGREERRSEPAAVGRLLRHPARQRRAVCRAPGQAGALPGRRVDGRTHRRHDARQQTREDDRRRQRRLEPHLLQSRTSTKLSPN